MDNILWLLIAIFVCIVFLFCGIFLGAFLGKLGSLEILNSIMRFPVTLLRSPRKLKIKWKMWQELRALKKIDLLKRKRDIRNLGEKIGSYKAEIRKLKNRIRRIKWGGNL